MNEIAAFFMPFLLIFASFCVFCEKSVIKSVLLMGIFSSLIALLYTFLNALDVAITEVAVGACVSTVIFINAIILTRDEKEVKESGVGFNGKTIISFASIIPLACVMIYAVVDIPFGDIESAQNGNLYNFYLEKTPEMMDFPNVVAAILASFRGYDTCCETIVVFVGAMSVMLIMNVDDKNISDENLWTRGLKSNDSVITNPLSMMLILFATLYSFYIQLHGEYSPGGGFQSGCILASGIIGYSLWFGLEPALRILPYYVGRILMCVGVLIYILTGVFCLYRGGKFLDYSTLSDASSVHGQQLGIFLVESGVGITVFSAMMTIYNSFVLHKND